MIKIKKDKENMIKFIFLTQISFCKHNFWLLKVENLCCVCREYYLIFFIPNLGWIYLYIPEIFKTNILNCFFSTESPFEFVFYRVNAQMLCVEKLVWNVCMKAFWYTNIYIFFVTVFLKLILKYVTTNNQLEWPKHEIL